DKAATVESGGEVEVHDPAAGRWVVVVDGYAVPQGGTSYAYLDLFTNPRLGTLSVTDVGERREPGLAWNALAHLWAASPPAAGRSLMARIDATSRELKSGAGSPATLGALYLELGWLRPR
ncbi:MAG TPA: hypothetical protein VGP61_00370, partial [Gemmatimonadales bacterium]|nr:hypothetical protein [Gemmatimonadales bacterium]